MVERFSSFSSSAVVLVLLSLLVACLMTEKRVFAYISLIGALFYETVRAIDLHGYGDGVIVAIISFLYWVFLFVAVLLPTKNGLGFASLLPKIILLFLQGGFFPLYFYGLLSTLVRISPYLIGTILIGALCLRRKPSKTPTVSTQANVKKNVSELITTLEKLESYQKAGLITEDEFEEKKAELFK